MSSFWEIDLLDIVKTPETLVVLFGPGVFACYLCTLISIVLYCALPYEPPPPYTKWLLYATLAYYASGISYLIYSIAISQKGTTWTIESTINLLSSTHATVALAVVESYLVLAPLLLKLTVRGQEPLTSERGWYYLVFLVSAFPGIALEWKGIELSIRSGVPAFGILRTKQMALAFSFWTLYQTNIMLRHGKELVISVLWLPVGWVAVWEAGKTNNEQVASKFLRFPTRQSFFVHVRSIKSWEQVLMLVVGLLVFIRALVIASKAMWLKAKGMKQPVFKRAERRKRHD